jgi:hypothetical protein
MRTRDWDWVPHLVVCYAVLAVLWIALALAMALVAGCEPAAFCGPPTPSQQFAATVVQIGALGIVPGLAIAATWRVFTNELRWRREGDPRGR